MTKKMTTTLIDCREEEGAHAAAVNDKICPECKSKIKIIDVEFDEQNSFPDGPADGFLYVDFLCPKCGRIQIHFYAEVPDYDRDREEDGEGD